MDGSDVDGGRMMTNGVVGKSTDALACETDGDGRISVEGVIGEGSTTVAGVDVEAGEDVVRGGLGKEKEGDEGGEK